MYDWDLFWEVEEFWDLADISFEFLILADLSPLVEEKDFDLDEIYYLIEL